MFLRRKPTPGIGTQMPNLPPTISNPAVASPPIFPPNAQETTQKQPTQPTAIPTTNPEKTINAAMITQLPSIYETLDIPTPESTSPQEQKQIMVDHLTKISSINQKVQTLETELKIEKEQLNKEITDLNKTLDEQERAVKSYFESIRQAISTINTQPTEINDKQNPPQSEISNEQNAQPKQQSTEDKNAKETQSKIQKQQPTRQEDTKTSEHTKED